jgi:hypothetical protein
MVRLPPGTRGGAVRLTGASRAAGRTRDDALSPAAGAGGRTSEEAQVPDSDEASADQPEDEAAAERRRLIDLTRAEKGMPERRNLRRLRHQPSSRSGKSGAAAADPPADEGD